MEGPSLADILRLVAASDEPVEHLRKLFEWQIERAMTSVRAMTAAVGAVFVALIAALLDDKGVTSWLLVSVVASVVLGLAFAWSRYGRAKKLEAEYVVALGVLRELIPLAPLIRQWPEAYVN
jgi:hypothetical protein